MKIHVIDFPTPVYEDVLNLQSTLFETLVESKKNHKKGEEYILIGEHEPVVTMGRNADNNNLLTLPQDLNKIGISVYHIDRGGDITYHCPGQIIVYPILDLERHKLGVKDFVNLLEEAVIRLLKNYGIKGERIPGATGVWIDKGTGAERKICAIGIRCSRFCTMHGLSLNVNADLSGFSHINPCGFTDKGVTSMALEKKGTLFEIEKIKKELLDILLGLIFPFEEVLNLPEQL